MGYTTIKMVIERQEINQVGGLKIRFEKRNFT